MGTSSKNLQFMTTIIRHFKPFSRGETGLFQAADTQKSPVFCAGYPGTSNFFMPFSRDDFAGGATCIACRFCLPPPVV
jgi:hypothetical protein